MRRLAVVVLIALTPACKKDAAKDQPPAAPQVDAAVGEVSKSATVFLDSLRLAEIDAGKASTYPPLPSMLPKEFATLDTWASIEVKGLHERSQTLISPAKTHPGEVAALFTMEGGVAFGFFAPDDLAKKGKPKMFIPAVVEVRIHTPEAEAPVEAGQGGGDGGGGGEEGGDRPVPSAALKITIKVGGKDQVFNGEQLAEVETTTAPVGDTETKGWTLPAVLEAAGVSAKAQQGKVVLYGDEGANLILEPGDLDPAKAVAFIKLNRQGKLRFRLFRKAGSTWDVAGELRGIASIELK